ncbi:hypothetical protein SteCoe_114 [Stentor coeruleus]|uniref:Ribosomal protein L38e n=1 Tax=Stentor coeruleus TaxID=5963 RepID=A0A1R2D539_9CILI|nr:hypothetical protein SteCoe_114 [Stentor coeruleus]
MPKEIKDVRMFIQKCRPENSSQKALAKHVTIKKIGKMTKFKLRCSQYLYTMVVDDAEKAEKIKKSLPPSLNKKEV